MKRALTFALALALLSAGGAFAQSPAAAPQPQTLEQLRQAIFQAGPAPLDLEAPLGALSPDVHPASTCTGDFCTQLHCECLQQCQPCGIARFNCVAIVCVCKQC